ncbi:epididymal secretory protein E3-beta [Nannospalax galili]|uniref:epididymal secretory protein E3-beta n=1 Tax=Nannospalax galili TaxID=1026970 RepID=UPI0004ED31DD|nr:epididymal secretory protein E3-beta [Nannospalax galili]XP_017653507.1 epididymal secretory protein E3-beta [Nannospalax galili]XP_017653508.1 epididymal secretory protein E3-beta [Nannospalax galili]
MASFLKAGGVFLVLLCFLCKLLVQSENPSRRGFMELHHLNPSKEFSEYNCDVLMKEKALKSRIFHVFIYISWFRVEHMCISGNWKDRYKNSYVWAQMPIKVLKCHLDSSRNHYRENRSYNYVQFHCNVDGYVDSIEDMKILQPIFF